jgi:hypothetical protein
MEDVNVGNGREGGGQVGEKRITLRSLFKVVE